MYCEQKVVEIKAITWKRNSHSLFDYQNCKYYGLRYQKQHFQVQLQDQQQHCIYRQVIPNHLPPNNSILQARQLVLGHSSFKTISFPELEFTLGIDKSYEKEGKVYVHLSNAVSNFKNQNAFGHFQNALYQNQEEELKVLQETLDRSLVQTSQQAKLHNEKEEIIFEEKLDRYIYSIVGRNIDELGKNGYKLQPGVIFKIGRVEFYVSEEYDGISDPIKYKRQELIPALKNYKQYENQTQNISCKICLSNHQTKDNFLLNPCACTGSCGAIHLECLREWMKIKVTPQFSENEQKCYHYKYEKLKCEICKSELPRTIEHKGVSYEIITIVRPKQRYIIIEGYSVIKTNITTKILFILQNIKESRIKLGRQSSCHIVINDIAVSREHAFIYLINNSFYLFDNHSKFGTLARREGKLTIALDHNKPIISLQVGRTVFQIQTSKKEIPNVYQRNQGLRQRQRQRQ